MRIRGACDDAGIGLGRLISLYALSESVYIPWQFNSLSLKASASVSARHSIWKTDVAFTLLSWAKCTLMTGRCFHWSEASVITRPAVAIGAQRSGDSKIFARAELLSVYDPSVKILNWFIPLS